MSAAEAVIYNAACNDFYIAIENATRDVARADIWNTVFRTDGRAATRDATRKAMEDLS